MGNFFSMNRANAGVPTYEVFLASLFVPVSTYVVAKVLGELLSLPGEEHPVERPEVYQVEPVTGAGTTKESTSEMMVDREHIRFDRVVERLEVRRNTREVYLRLLQEPKTARELMDLLGVTKAAVYKQLRALEEEGVVVRNGGKWEVVKRD